MPVATARESATACPPPEPNSSRREPSGSVEPRHVLDDADDLLMGLQRDRPGPFCHLTGRDLRSCDDEQLGGRDELGDRDRDISGAGRQIHQQNVKITPVHVSQELL